MKYTNETGRSMVEMLGVLAIIGVLSVGGIAGYTRAMRTWRANEIIDAANKVVVQAETNDSGTANYADDVGDLTKVAGNVVESIEATRASGGGTVAIALKNNTDAMQKVKAAIDDKMNNSDEANRRTLAKYVVTVTCGAPTPPEE